MHEPNATFIRIFPPQKYSAMAFDTVIANFFFSSQKSIS